MLFRAYLARAEQLMKNGQTREAEETAGQVNPHVKDVSWLEETDLLYYVSLYPGAEAFDVYSRYVRYHGRVPEAENRLASHLFGHRHWVYADRLDGTVPLKQDVGIVQESVSLMDAGAWEKALECLRPLPRKSPFAPVRLFCRAMAAFYSEKDSDAVRALSMIPDHFPLSGVKSQLKDILSTPRNSPQRQEAKSRLPMLWEGPVNLKTDIRKLIQHLDRGDIRGIGKAMRQLAQSISPENPKHFCAMLLRIAWWAVFTEKLSPDAYLKLASSLVSDKQAKGLHTRMMISAGASFTYAGKYLKNYLETDFQDIAERNIAHSSVLIFLGRQIISEGLLDDITPSQVPDQYREVLGIESTEPDLYLIEMTAKALGLDPLNREGYALLATLPRASRKSRKTVEAAMLPMLKNFPDDPFPCLELASLYYENNAFRKAENILEEAMRRAPHDDRVIDKHAVSLLISSEKNINRKKFHLATPDIERAGTLESKNTAPYIAAKRMLLLLINPTTLETVLKPSKKQLSLFQNEVNFSARLDQELSPLSPVTRIRMTSFLFLDLENRHFSQKKSILKYLLKQLKADLKQVKTLPSSDIVSLLSPLGKDYAAVFPCLNPAPLLLKHAKNLLSFIKTDDITTVYDVIMADATYAPIQKDIRKRLKHADKKKKIILKFYLATIRHLSGDSRSYDQFYDVLDEVNDVDEAAAGAVIDELRAAARRLSRHATGNLRHALSRFNFGPLPKDEIFPPFDDDDGFPFPEDFWDDEMAEDEFLDAGDSPLSDPAAFSNILEDFELHPNALADMLEMMVDQFDIRGLPGTIIKGARKMLLSPLPGMMNLFNTLAKRLDPDDPDVAGLSPEAHVLLYGNVRKKKGRKRR